MSAVMSHLRSVYRPAHERRERVSRRRSGAILSMSVLLALTACGSSASHSARSSAPTSSAASSSSAATTNPNPSSASHSATSAAPSPAQRDSGVGSTGAAHLSIPSIGLDHPVTPGGLTGGVLSPPPGSIVQFHGYQRVTPGMPGIAVLAGHVTYNGPDAFYRLHAVPVGAGITITYGNGSTKKFVVTGKASVEKDALQNDPRVWGTSATPVVALVTCDAASAWVNAQHHANNYVVWARPA